MSILHSWDTQAVLMLELQTGVPLKNQHANTKLIAGARPEWVKTSDEELAECEASYKDKRWSGRGTNCTNQVVLDWLVKEHTDKDYKKLNSTRTPLECCAMDDAKTGSRRRRDLRRRRGTHSPPICSGNTPGIRACAAQHKASEVKFKIKFKKIAIALQDTPKWCKYTAKHWMWKSPCNLQHAPRKCAANSYDGVGKHAHFRLAAMKSDACDHINVYHGTPMLTQHEVRTGRSYLLMAERLTAKLRFIDITSKLEQEAKTTTAATLYGPTSLAALTEHEAFTINEHFVFSQLDLTLSIPCSNLEQFTKQAFDNWGPQDTANTKNYNVTVGGIQYAMAMWSGRQTNTLMLRRAAASVGSPRYPYTASVFKKTLRACMDKPSSEAKSLGKQSSNPSIATQSPKGFVDDVRAQMDGPAPSHALREAQLGEVLQTTTQECALLMKYVICVQPDSKHGATHSTCCVTKKSNGDVPAASSFISEL